MQESVDYYPCSQSRKLISARVSNLPKGTQLVESGSKPRSASMPLISLVSYVHIHD